MSEDRQFNIPILWQIGLLAAITGALAVLLAGMAATRTNATQPELALIAAGMLVCVLLCLLALRQIAGLAASHTLASRHLRQSRQSLETILEELPVGVALIGADRKIRNINKAALNLLGMEKSDDLTGRLCSDHLCGLEACLCPVTEAQNQVFTTECYLQSRKGPNPAVLRQAVSLQLDGEPVILETFMDISERKTAEQTVIENQHFINAILKTATVGIVVVDAANRTIVEANPAAVRMLGYEKQVLIGSGCRQAVCPRNANGCPIIDHGAKVDNRECELKTSGNHIVPVIKHAAATYLNGRMYIIESFTDITDLKQARDQADRLNAELEQRVAQRTAQLEEANAELKNALEELKEAQSRLIQSEKLASIGQLAAGVAHEINNPVGFVKFNLHTIDEYRTDLIRFVKDCQSFHGRLKQAGDPRKVLDDGLPRLSALGEQIDIDYILDDFSGVVSESAEGLDRVTKIVSDLKNFAYMGRDAEQWTDLNAGIESTLNIVWNQLKYKAEVVKDLEDLPAIRCYPQRINQVFMNLLVNAGQAMEEKGCITIKTRAENDSVAVTISDTGHGIAPENLNKIFDPFFTTKEVGQGTGLGLNVVYNIVQNHNGRIDVDSTPGKGTTFTVRLPIEPEPQGGK